MEQKDVWDKIATSWSARRVDPPSFITSFLSGKTGRVLDLACGSGRNLVKIKGLEYFGVDFSSEMIRHARKNSKNKGIVGDFRVEPANHLSFEDNFFDFALYIAALHCLESSSSRKESLKELYRVLQPGGEALISVWSKSHSRLKNKKKDAFIPWTIGKSKFERYYYIYEIGELREILESIGFGVMDSYEEDNIVFHVTKE